MKTEVGIDWLAATWRADAVLDVRHAQGVLYELCGLGATLIRGRGLHGYRASVTEPETGVLVLYDGRADMGVHYILPGKACQGGRGEKALRHAVERAHIITRLDLAWDMHDGWLAVSDYAREFKAGRVPCSAKKWALITGTTGETLYIGSRTSERMLRVYDKRAEQGTDGPPWLRLELECKGAYANAIARALLDLGLGVIPSIVDAFASFVVLPEYKSALDLAIGGAINTPTRARITDTRKWLLESVSGTLARECADDLTFWNEFVRSVWDKIAESEVDIP